MPFAPNEIKIQNQRILDILMELSKRRNAALNIVQRANIIVLAVEGCSNAQIVKELNISRNNASKWRNRFITCLPILESVALLKPKDLRESILGVLSDLPRPGAPAKYTAEQNLKIREIACRTPKKCNKERTQWSHKAIADYCNEHEITKSISPRTVGRYLNEANIKPHLNKYWLHSTEKIESPETYKTKINNICAMYGLAQEIAALELLTKQVKNVHTEFLGENDGVPLLYDAEGIRKMIASNILKLKNVHIISTDEMTGIQALERKYPDKPVAPGMIAKYEFEYIRHGTITLIGFFDVVDGKMKHPYFNATRKENDFVDAISNLLRDDEDGVWVFVCDNLNTHKSEALVRFVAEKLGIPQESLGAKGVSGVLKDMNSRAEFLHREDHRIRFVYTPKHCSWMNQIEVWFGILNRQLLKKGSYISIEEMVLSIFHFIYQYNLTAKPFKWKYQGIPSTTPTPTPAPTTAA